MDIGHYNCRDYHVTPHFAPTTLTNNRAYLLSSRHESFDELERRARSPASQKAKFPLLKLPLELRQQIFNYLLPWTEEVVSFRGSNTGAIVNSAASKAAHIVWRRGDIGLFGVCRQLHNECADLMYGGNTFLLFVTYSGIVFRFNWLLQSGLSPSRRFPFLELLPQKYLSRVKRVIINIDHVDGYTATIKFNVSPQGLVHGLRGQVQKLVTALQSSAGGVEDKPDDLEIEQVISRDRRLAKVAIRVSTSNDVLEQIRTSVKKHRDPHPSGICACPGSHATSKGTHSSSVNPSDVRLMLEPFGQLQGVREVEITGAVLEDIAAGLQAQMVSLGESKVKCC